MSRMVDRFFVRLTAPGHFSCDTASRETVSSDTRRDHVEELRGGGAFAKRGVVCTEKVPAGTRDDGNEPDR